MSYSSLYRFVALRSCQGRIRNTVRMGESVPREVSKLDFGRLGFIDDQESGRRRTVWCLW